MITIGSTWWNGLLVVASLALGMVFLARAVLTDRDRAACGAHALMGLAMAGMFWPSGDPTPAAAGALVFALIGAWFAAGWLRSGSGRLDGPAHVVIGSAAMVLMYLIHRGGAHVGSGDAGHALHGGGAASTGGSGALLAAAGLVFTGYFVWHAWELLTRRGERDGTAASPGTTALRDRLRTEPAAHVGMSLLMAVMFLGTI